MYKFQLFFIISVIKPDLVVSVRETVKTDVKKFLLWVKRDCIETCRILEYLK